MDKLYQLPPELLLPEYYGYIHRGMEGTPPEFGQGDTFTNPHFWRNICIILYDIICKRTLPYFSLVSSKFFFRSPPSLNCILKKLFQKLEIFACNVTSKYNYIFYIFWFYYH